MKYILLLVSVLTSLNLAAQTVPTPPQTDEIIIDNGTSGKADPGDRIRYKVTIQNTGAGNATGVKLNAIPDPRTTLDGASFRTSPLAMPDAYSCIGNVGITVPAVSGLLANDFDDNPAGLTATAGTFATAQGGSITIAANGSFSYNPPSGFEGTDTYQYTLNDGNAVMGVTPTDLGTVTFTVSGMIWFINNNAGACVATCDGRMSNPYTSLAAFNTANALSGGLNPDNNDNIFIYESATAYTGGIVLRNGQKLFGQDATVSLATAAGLTVPTFSNPLPTTNSASPFATITNSGGDGVTLADGNTLRGFTVGNCSDFGIENSGTTSVGNLVVSELTINNTTGGGFDASHGSGASMDVVFASLSSTGGTNGINLTNCAGTFTVNGGTITNPTGTGVLISGGTVTFSSSGAITDNTGFAVDVDNHDSANGVTFSGNITSTGTGIRVQNCGAGTKTFSGSTKTLNTGANTAVTLTSNTGATINFTGGGLAITTTSGSGFSATGGGTINVTGTNNTISSTTGTALNVANTTIGASNLNFLSIAAHGAANGIVLNTTGSSGGLIVTGTGTTDGSGGTIQSITNRGVSATSTSNLSLKNMTFTNANITDAGTCGASDNSGCNAAIYLNTVTNATLDNVDINGTAQQGINVRETSGFQLLNSTLTNTGAGGQTEEAGLYAINLFGTASINNTTITFPAERCAVIYNTNKTLTMTVNNSQFNDTQTSALGADGFEMTSFGSSVTDLDITNCTFLRCKTNGVQFLTEGSAQGTVVITGCTVDPQAGVGVGFEVASNGTSTLNFNIANNPVVKGRLTSIINCFAQGNSTMDGQVHNNVVTSLAGSGSGIRAVATDGTSNMRIKITNNTISNIANDNGITCTASQGTGRMDATITGNNVSILSTAAFNIQVVAGASSSTFTNKACANVANNTVSPAPISGSIIANFQGRAATPSHELLLQGSSPIATYWNSKGNMPTDPTATVIQTGTGTFTYNATCLLPSYP